jgi:hypothetical protein
MLVINAGMQKSGTGYFYNVLNDLHVAAGNTDARHVKREHDLHHLMQHANNLLPDLSHKTLRTLWRVSVAACPFVVKTHAGPTRAARRFSSLGRVKIVYNYRDPRDVLLSAMDHGRKNLSEGNDGPFIKLAPFDEAVKAVKRWLQVWRKYREMPDVLMVRYEDLLRSPAECLAEVERFLCLPIDPATRTEILWRYSRDNPHLNKGTTHFNKGEAFRYRREMTEEQQKQAQRAFGDCLREMGYDPLC